jgi:hypothetical protein
MLVLEITTSRLRPLFLRRIPRVLIGANDIAYPLELRLSAHAIAQYHFIRC